MVTEMHESPALYLIAAFWLALLLKALANAISDYRFAHKHPRTE